jgi:hypothetical protein
MVQMRTQRALRMVGARRRWAVALALAIAGTVVVPAALPASAGAAPARAAAPSAARCGPDDRPERGVSGEVRLIDQLSGASRLGASCNLRWVGGHRLVGGDTQMTWFGRCAYRVVPSAGLGAPSDGVAVLDVRDPSRPRWTTTLREPQWAGQGGVLNVHEGIHASERSGLLVVPAGRVVSTYDVRTDCTRPKLLSTFDTGRAADLVSQTGATSGFHSGQLSPDGTFWYGTTTGVEGFLAPLGPCLTVVDLLDPRHPKVATRWGGGFPCHDLGFDPSGQRAYVGTYTTTVGHPSAVVAAFTPVGIASKLLTGMTVVDVSEIAAREPGGRIVQLGQVNGGDQHTETFARIGGRPYVIGAEEATCPNGNGRIVDVSDPERPRQVSKITLGVNRPIGCPATVLETDRQDNLLLYTSHYVSVDDPDDATLAFFSWYAAGLRVFDIRDPAHPVEVAYFNPPVGRGSALPHDSTTTYPRYVSETGQIWVGSGVNAFWIVELDPRLRPEALRGAPPARWSSRARAGGPAASFLSTVVPAAARPPTYCSLL